MRRADRHPKRLKGKQTSKSAKQQTRARCLHSDKKPNSIPHVARKSSDPKRRLLLMQRVADRTPQSKQTLIDPRKRSRNHKLKERRTEPTKQPSMNPKSRQEIARCQARVALEIKIPRMADITKHATTHNTQKRPRHHPSLQR